MIGCPNSRVLAGTVANCELRSITMPLQPHDLAEYLRGYQPSLGADFASAGIASAGRAALKIRRWTSRASGAAVVRAALQHRISADVVIGRALNRTGATLTNDVESTAAQFSCALHLASLIGWANERRVLARGFGAAQKAAIVALRTGQCVLLALLVCGARDGAHAGNTTASARGGATGVWRGRRWRRAATTARGSTRPRSPASPARPRSPASPARPRSAARPRGTASSRDSRKPATPAAAFDLVVTR